MRYFGLSLALLCLVAGSVSASIVSDFGDGTLQGWVATGDVAGVSNPGSGGNPGGYVRMVDQAVGGVCWILAPSQYLGDWHAKASLSADLIQLSYSGSHYQNVQFILTGPGGQYTHDFGERPPLGNWRTYGVPLEESQWTRNSGTWSALLDNVSELKISMEFINGDETNGLDTVALADDYALTTIGLAKQMRDGSEVMVDGVVTLVTGGFMYVQDEDRSAGIRVKNSFPLKQGDRIRISGELATDHNERYLKNGIVRSVAHGDLPRPLGIRNSELGGVGATPADPALGSSTTLKETGLLVRATGKISAVSMDGTFTLDDGSRSPVTARCADSQPLPITGAYAAVTGVSGNDDATSPAPIILAVTDPDIYAMPLDQNLIRNPGAEEGTGGDGSVVSPIPAWNITSNFVVQNYGVGDMPASQSSPINGGRSYFMGGPNTALSSATQSVDLGSLRLDIDAGLLTADLSAYLAGWELQGDNMTVTATFMDSAGAPLGTMQLGPQAGSNQVWIHHERTAPVPIGARSVSVNMLAIRTDGAWNSCYADSLSLVLSRD